MLNFFSPSEFKGDPYTAGLNQMGHVVFGAALCVLLGIWVAGALVVVWEAYQLKRMGARKSDYGADLLFWFAGLVSAGWLYMPVLAVGLGGLWMGVTWLRD